MIRQRACVIYAPRLEEGPGALVLQIGSLHNPGMFHMQTILAGEATLRDPSLSMPARWA